MSQSTDLLSRLPLELFGYICNEIRHHKGTLMSASLASRSFLSFCRPHLFHTLRVPLNRNPMKPSWDRDIRGETADVRFLAESTLPSYVRDLRVELPSTLSTGMYIAALILFLEKLSKIQALSIRTTPITLSNRRWTVLPSSFRSVFFNLLRSHPIVFIRMYDISDFPPQLFRCCRFLKRLALDMPNGTSIPRFLNDEFDVRRSEEKTELEALEISAAYWLSQLSASLFTHPHAPFCLSKLVHLRVHIQDLEGHKACQMLVDSSKNCLRDFDLIVSGPRDFTIFALSPGMCFASSNRLVQKYSYTNYD